MVVHCAGGWLGLGSRRLASLGPFLGASTWCVSTTVHGSCGGVQHVPGGELIVVCQYHRSCRYVEVASFFGVTSTGAVLGQGC